MHTYCIFLIIQYIVQNKSNISRRHNSYEYLFCALTLLARLLERADSLTIDFCITWACRAILSILKETDFVGLRLNDEPHFRKSPIHRVGVSSFVNVRAMKLVKNSLLPSKIY